MLSNFLVAPAEFQIDQDRSLAWLAKIHAASEATLHGLDSAATEAFEAAMTRRIQRCACNRSKIANRGHVLPDIGTAVSVPQTTDLGRLPSIYNVETNPQGHGTAARSRVFDQVVTAYFESAYAACSDAPTDLIHVTCTGYVSPSGAQKLVASKGWSNQTHVTHAYQMGCYAAFPALRIAAGFVASPSCLSSRGADRTAETRGWTGSTAIDQPRRVDIVHTELCTLHLDPSDHRLEQLVVQSLFADGFIRYSMQAMPAMPASSASSAYDNRSQAMSPSQQRGLEILAIRELIVPETAGSMSWSVGDAGMQMTLARDVPAKIATVLREFVTQLCGNANLSVAALRDSIAAVHPGGPKIIDGVRDVLELTDAQVQTSRDVLFDHGNMSSATLPHIWARLVADPAVVAGTLILSLAFGPGLTVCGGLFRKL